MNASRRRLCCEITFVSYQMTPKAGFIKLFHQGLSTSQRRRAPAVDPGSEQGSRAEGQLVGKEAGTTRVRFLPPATRAGIFSLLDRSLFRTSEDLKGHHRREITFRIYWRRKSSWQKADVDSVWLLHEVLFDQSQQYLQTTGKKYYTSHTAHTYEMSHTSLVGSVVWWLERGLWSQMAWISATTSLPNRRETMEDSFTPLCLSLLIHKGM